MTEADVWSSLTRAVGAAVAATAPSEDPRRLTTLLDRIGWAPDLVPIDAVREALTALATLPTDPPDDLDEIARLLATVGAAIDLLRAAGHGLPGDAATELGRDLVEALTIAGIRDRVPVAWAVLVLLGLAVNGDPADPVPELRDADGRLLRRAMARPQLRLDRLPDLLTDPVASLRERYRPDGFADAAATAAAADRLLPPVRDLVHALGGIAVFGFTPDELYDLGEDGNRAAASMLTFMLPTGPEDLDGPDLPDSVGAGASVALEPADGAGPGVVIVPHGAVSATGAVGRWEFSASVSGEAEGLLVRVDGVVGAPGSPPRLVADLRAALKPGADEPAFRLGPATGTRLDVGGLDVRALFDSGDDGPAEIGVELTVTGLALRVRAGKDDGFLSAVLPPDGIGVTVDATLGWSSRDGLRVRVGANVGDGLKATVPVGLVLGPVTVSTVHLLVEPRTGAEPSLDLVVALSAGLTIGPFAASVEGLGLVARLRPRPDGNLGPLDLALELRPPTGAGLSLRTPVVSGGGALSFGAGRYVGVFELTVLGMVSVKVVAIITTRLPGGAPGFALLLVITAEGFTPIQLGLGFVLTGIGGLVALNRSIDVDAVRDGLRSGVLDSVLFVDKPVENVDRIVSTLERVFPLAPDRLLVGPLAEIGWGSPSIVRVRLALLLELPHPIRIVLLAALSMALPDEHTPVVQIRVDAIGVLDLGRGELSLDASLHDSRLWTWSLRGDMALRLGWGERPVFLLAIGGLHPRAERPPGLRKLDRITLELSSSDNPRIRLESYLAVTSNSIQFGARVELFADFGGFGVDGGAAFDALVRWAPFGIDVAFEAWVTVFTPAGPLLAVRIAVALTGPTPWRVIGTARVTFLFITVEARIDFTTGEALDPAPPAERVDVARLLWKSISDDAGWQAVLPASVPPSVTVSDGGSAAVHPAARVEVRQKDVPLETTITRIGALRPTEVRSLSLEVDSPTGLVVEALTAPFASAQFTELSDAEKLSRPAFEPYVCGVTLSAQRGAGIPLDLAAVTVAPTETLDVRDLAEPAVAVPDAVDLSPVDAESLATPDGAVR